jgi:hypothetical protein
MANLWYKSDAKELKYTEIYFDSRDVKNVAGAYGSDPTNFDFVLSKAINNVVGYQLWECTFGKASAHPITSYVLSSLSPAVPKASTFQSPPTSSALGKVLVPIGETQFNSLNFTTIKCGPQNLSKLQIKIIGAEFVGGLMKYDFATIANYPTLGFDASAGDYISGTIRVWTL